MRLVPDTRRWHRPAHERCRGRGRSGAGALSRPGWDSNPHSRRTIRHTRVLTTGQSPPALATITLNPAPRRPPQADARHVPVRPARPARGAAANNLPDVVEHQQQPPTPQCTTERTDEVNVTGCRTRNRHEPPHRWSPPGHLPDVPGSAVRHGHLDDSLLAGCSRLTACTGANWGRHVSAPRPAGRARCVPMGLCQLDGDRRRRARDRRHRHGR